MRVWQNTDRYRKEHRPQQEGRWAGQAYDQPQDGYQTSRSFPSSCKSICICKYLIYNNLNFILDVPNILVNLNQKMRKVNLLENVDHLSDGVLTLGHSQAIPGHDDNILRLHHSLKKIGTGKVWLKDSQFLLTHQEKENIQGKENKYYLKDSQSGCNIPKRYQSIDRFR